MPASGVTLIPSLDGQTVARLIESGSIGERPNCLMRWVADACDQATNFTLHGSFAYAGGYFSLDP